MNESDQEQTNKLGLHRLLHKDAFLALLVLTFINAIVFIYYRMNPSYTHDYNSAKKEWELFVTNVPSFVKIQHIFNLHGNFKSIESVEFKNAVKGLELPFDYFIQNEQKAILFNDSKKINPYNVDN